MDQVLIHGFFHADPHPGNVFVDEAGKIIFIVYGSMGTLNRHEINAVQNILIYFLLKNTEKLIEVVKGLAIDYHIPDERKLKIQVDELVNIFSSRDINKVDITVLIDKFKEISKKNQITFPHSIYLLVRGLTLIEGTVRQLIPEINLSIMFKPHLFKLVSGKLNRDSLINNLIPMGMKSLDLMRNLPMRLNRLSEALTDENFTIQVKNSTITEENIFRRVHLIGYYALLIALIILTFIQVKNAETWDAKKLVFIVFLCATSLFTMSRLRAN